jgi:hypothetical protein
LGIPAHRPLANSHVLCVRKGCCAKQHLDFHLIF